MAPFVHTCVCWQIRFNVHPRHAVLIILFLVSAFFAMFIFASFREVIPLYSVYFDALTWEGKLKRSGMNVLVRMLLAFIMYGAVRPIDASAAASSYTNSYLPRFQTIRGFFQNKLRQLSHHQPTQLAPAWRHMLFYYILGAMVTALLYVWFTFCYPVEFMEGLSGNALEKGNREMHAAIVGTVASLMVSWRARAHALWTEVFTTQRGRIPEINFPEHLNVLKLSQDASRSHWKLIPLPPLSTQHATPDTPLASLSTFCATTAPLVHPCV